MSCNQCANSLSEAHIYNKRDFKRWALRNHPDKGGSEGKYQDMSNCIDDWFGPNPKCFKELSPSPIRKRSVKKSYRGPMTPYSPIQRTRPKSRSRRHSSRNTHPATWTLLGAPAVRNRSVRKRISVAKKKMCMCPCPTEKKQSVKRTRSFLRGNLRSTIHSRSKAHSRSKKYSPIKLYSYSKKYPKKKSHAKSHTKLHSKKKKYSKRKISPCHLPCSLKGAVLRRR